MDFYTVVSIASYALTSNWPLSQTSVRWIIPDATIKQLSTHPLSQDCFPLGYGHYPSASCHQMERSSPVDHLIIYCHQGSGWLQTNQQSVSVVAGDVLLLPRSIPHAYGADKGNPWSIFWVHFEGKKSDVFMDYLQTTLHSAKPSPHHHYCKPCGLSSYLLAQFDQLLSVQDSGQQWQRYIYSTKLLQQLLSYLPILQSKPKSPTGINLTTLQLYMERNIHRGLTLKALAQQANLSPSHFSRQFKALTGYAPLHYFNQLKIQRACYLLDVSDKPIAAVAQHVGFNDVYYFSRLFKQHTGIAPSQYRQLQRQSLQQEQTMPVHRPSVPSV
ncbi:AraC family transcriptional regulator [Zooshikella ganghwensis]|uniref:AraC family transcriptional regulator n=1 Tax=Zooshikella ganghwensis TaxID=202772 RepID=A0A4P9VRP4_9GAMM|nr:AraC family transcriptional regulator [Zooshikella ganghwensis]RDH45084.1 AraC family transcriptional regulator [Zooshikella ganghwensis]